MRKRAGAIVAAVIGLVVLGTATVVAQGPKWYPAEGWFYYNGWNFADSYLRWPSPGSWGSPDPGYEHDLRMRWQYFEFCTSWTNLPSGYDDCPTAGQSESGDPNYKVFSFGSFHIQNVYPNWWYYGSYNLVYAGPLQSTDFILKAQEVYHGICWWDSIWCMLGLDPPKERILFSGWLYEGYPWGPYMWIL